MNSSPPKPRLFSVAWPMLLELILHMGVGLVGTLMAARISDPTGAAFALANNVSITLFMLFRIVAVGIGVVVTQSLGARRRDVADDTARAVLAACTWSGGTSALVAVFAARPLLGVLNAPADLMPLAQPYLQVLGVALLIDAWNAALSTVLRAHLRTRNTLAVLIGVQLGHIGLAALLMPVMGLPGYAVAAIVSRMVGFGLFLWLWHSLLHIRVQLSDWWRLRWEPLWQVLRIGGPGALENLAWRLAFVASVAVAARFGTQAVATHTYVMQFTNFILLFGLATGLSAEIVVGHMVGAGKLHDANRLVRRALARGLAVTVAVAGAAALSGPWLLGLFTHDPDIQRTGATLLWLTLLLEPGRTFNIVVINALRATGDVSYPVQRGFLSMLIVLAGGSWLLGAHFGLGLPGIWLAYAADEWLRGLIMWRRWVTLGWVPHARAAHRRLRRARAQGT